MIISDEWVWVHFPKCGGNTVDRLLRKAFPEGQGVVFDPLTDPNYVHQSILQREQSDPKFELLDRKVISNFRRLPEWLISWVHFTRTVRHPSFTPRAVLEQGSIVLATGKPQKADIILRKYLQPKVDYWVRVESIPEDLSRAVNVEIPSGPIHANKAKTEYVRDMTFWFTEDQLERIYLFNPLWAAVERKVYGATLAD